MYPGLGKESRPELRAAGLYRLAIRDDAVHGLVRASMRHGLFELDGETHGNDRHVRARLACAEQEAVVVALSAAQPVAFTIEGEPRGRHQRDP